MTDHTPEPWYRDIYGNGLIRSERRQRIAGTSDDKGFVGNSDLANADRIVACVNACEGITDPVAAVMIARAVLRRVLHRGRRLEVTDDEIDQNLADAIARLGGDP